MVIPDEVQPGVGWGNLWSRVDSRTASQICSGGVSAVMRCLQLVDSSVDGLRHIRQSVQSRIADH